MKLRKVQLTNFKRFTNLTISEIPEETKLVVLTGPNGSGKSSLFEAFNFWMSWAKSRVHFDPEYHSKDAESQNNNWSEALQKIKLDFYDYDGNSIPQSIDRKEFYLRSAYRHEADFETNGIQKTESILIDSHRPANLIQAEHRVSDNYQRIIGRAVNALFNDNDLKKKSGEDISDELIGKVREAVKKVFSGLSLNGPGNPTEDGTFRFSKGNSVGFHYKNLSGGEKAAFDLLLDFVVKREAFNDTIFCIDEPELHMHTRLQAKLLEVMFELIPDNCQLWLTTHSIGMARKAAELKKKNQTEVQFIDFHGFDFDHPQSLVPSIPNRNYWKNIFDTALDDLAELVVPENIVFCEGRRIGESGRKPSFDSEVYSVIFGAEFPNTEFIPLGGASQVSIDGDMLKLLLARIAPGIKAWKVFDRDDRNESEIKDIMAGGGVVLLRRDIESYLWDDEVIGLLCKKHSKVELVEQIISAKNRFISTLDSRGKPNDDVKAIAGQLYREVKSQLGLSQSGNTPEAFAIEHLAPIIPQTAIYEELKHIIFVHTQKPPAN
ncbi:AAA family ATPase [Ningiella sp. W23]|uniref:AAA family ATPase n=1 Tax=Ningiella sp. W23 TaxID=3023715 RepID=UPI00375700B9